MAVLDFSTTHAGSCAGQDDGRRGCTTSFTGRLFSLHFCSLRAACSDFSPASYGGKSVVESQTDEKLLPIDPNTKRPIAPSKQPGYYPGYSTLSQKKFWDATTREVVEQRVYDVPKIRFFTPEES